MSGKSKAVSDEYTSALSDLNFNSKPMINVLTMLAEENSDYAQVIVQCICDRIKKVGVDQKMPSLYLLDSILKNIGGEYVAIIAKHIVNTFCSVFESANDERKRMQLFKLRNTWAQYVPNSTLYELDIRISRTDPNWPIASPHNGSSNALPVKTNASHQKMIHVNPKFLQKNDTTKLVAGNKLDTSISGEKSNMDASKLQSKISKQRLLDEEKRVQEQLKLLQTEKLKRDRERHELELKQQHLERERLLAEQKRQLEVLRKQQQTLSSPNENKNTLLKGQTRQIGVKDPRLKGASTSSNTVPTREKVTSHSDASKQFKFNAKGNDGAVSVMNKIMTTLKTKPTAQQLAKERMTKGKRSPMTSPTNVNAPSTKASKSVSPLPKSVSPPTTPNKTATTNSTSSTTSKVTASNLNLDSPKKTREVVSDPPNHSGTVAPPTSVPPLPYSAAFTQLSTRDMQIAAQAAAIATAMHQMQSGINAPMVPEQSAMIAAQLVKVMQGSTQPALNPVTTTTAAISSEVNAVVTTTSVTSSPLPVSVNQQTSFARTDGKEKKSTEEGRLNERRKDRYQERESRKDEFARDAQDNTRKIPGNDRKYNGSRNTSPPSDQAEARKQRERIKERNKSPERRKDQSSNNKRANEGNEHTERPRKARARSPSRYYCRVEQKMEVNKRVEEKEKQLVLQRIRKNSGGEVGGKMRKKSDSSTHDETLPDDLENIELPEVETVLTPNVRSSTQPAPAVKTENLVGMKPDKMTNMEWEALKKIRKKEYIVLNTKLLDVKRKKEQPLDPNVFLKLKDEAGFKFKEGKLSKEQTDDIFNQIDVIRNEIKLHQSNEHLHWRSRQDLNHLSPLKHPAGRNNVRPRFNDPRHPAVFNDGLPQHHMRNGPRHFRGGPPHRPHMGERLPLHVGEGPSHIRDRLPPPHMANGPRPNIRENAVPPFIREGPPPPHMREGPVPHMREGPLPSHLRDGYPPDHTREGPIPPHLRNGPPPVHREDDGPRPPFIRDRPHFRDANMGHEFNGPPRFNGPPKHFREGPLPPHMANENMEPRMTEQNFFRSNSPQPPMHYVEPPYKESFEPRHSEARKPVDVSNLLGQLFRAGILDNVKTEPEVDLNVPTIPFNLDDLRRRHQAVINHLFQGLQCSSCGQRFPDDARQQYSEHLDWHFRQNRKEKDGDRKVSSRTWFYDLSDWIEHAEKTVGEDGKVQSELFEAEKAVKSEESDAPIKTSRKKTEDRSVPVLPDDGEAVCSVCMEPLEQFWDEDQEEWRYSKAVRENKKVYHYHCFTDYVPFEFEQSTTPRRTPRSSVTDDTKQEFDSSFSPPPEIKEEPEETQQIIPVNTKLNARKDDGISDVAPENNLESQKCLKESTNVTSTLTKLSLPKPTEVIPADSIKKEPPSPNDEQQQKLVVNKVTKADTVKEKPVEKIDQQKNETENLDELDAPNSPEFPFVSSATLQSIPVSPTEEVITKNEDGSVTKLDAGTENVIIGVKRSIDSDFESNARKEMKMDVKAETSINDCAISVEEPCVTEVQPKLNKSDNEAI
ncbi:pre-mRNA cleavage complex 2 protein Pcf11-like [Hydractinia symbiolongicarpus]|uniref:pre-mRNA cleavage complex 2 protein Pcf11-like n=1 Tax=Hydractinia symbiolongicarpus TaxID=13093 RepID=UPI00254DA54B|nr:pre-mRNA cleavage complex 2 protein Pcf11-like [Hydractinia symbiolongicarpus]